jgi:RND family efflux transporter MFP subunit
MVSPARVAALLLLAGAAGVSALFITGTVRAGDEDPAADSAMKSQRQSAPEVTTERVTPRAFHPSIRVTGRLRSEEEAALSTKATGRVREVRVKEGDRVRRGELLVRIDDGELVARRERALAMVRSQEAKLKQARMSRLEASRTGLAQRQVNDNEIAAARAEVAKARADARYYAGLIAQTRLHSPVDGVVSRKAVHVGETVSPGSGALLKLVAMDAIYLEATAPEAVLPYLRAGQAATVTLDARPGRTIAGSVRAINPVAEGNTRSARLRIGLAHGAHLSASVGDFARATLQGESRGLVISVPRAAIQSDEGQRGVYVLNEERAYWRLVRLGEASGDSVAVLRGLRAGDRVILSGASLLTDGQQVRIKER